MSATITLNGIPLDVESINYDSLRTAPERETPVHYGPIVYRVECTLEQTPLQREQFFAFLRTLTPAKRWRKKHRVGVHCERRHRMTNSEMDLWCNEDGMRWVAHGRAEMARRFFAGQRRPVRRRLDTLNGRLVEELRRYGDARLVA